MWNNTTPQPLFANSGKTEVMMYERTVVQGTHPQANGGRGEEEKASDVLTTLNIR